MEYKVKDYTKKSVYSDLLEIASSNPDWGKLKNSTVFVTGAGGFIGFYLPNLSSHFQNRLYRLLQVTKKNSLAEFS